MKRTKFLGAATVGLCAVIFSVGAFAQTPYVPPSQTADNPSASSSSSGPATPPPSAAPAPTQNSASSPTPVPVTTPAPSPAAGDSATIQANAPAPYTPPSETAGSSSSGLQTQIDELKTRVDSLQTTGAEKQPLAGYNGGFFIQSQDQLFSLKMNFTANGIIGAQVIQEAPDAFTSRFGTAMTFQGSVFDPKLSYMIHLALGTKSALVDALELGYAWKDQLNFHGGVIGLPTLIGDVYVPQFVGPDLPYNRYSLGSSFGFYFDGTFWHHLHYTLAITNSPDTVSINTNQELAYSLELTFGDLDNFGAFTGDYEHHDKLSYIIDAGAALYHLDTNPQARGIHGNAGAAIKWKGFNFLVQGYSRLLDQDQFTIQQLDAAYLIQAGYFIVPKKFEVALRADGLLDDMNDAGLNLNMQGADAFFNYGGSGSVTLADADGDSDNEYSYTAEMNYYIYKTKLVLRAMYSYVIDGKPGPADPVYQAALLKLSLSF